MKQQIHRIFEETGCVSQDALIRYRDNKLNDEEKHEVERHFVDCELCTDALEGLSIGVSAAYLDEVREEVMERITGKPGATSFSSSARWLVAAAISAVVIMSIYTYLEFEKVEDDNVALHEKNFEEEAPASTVNESLEQPVALTESGSEPSSETRENPVLIGDKSMQARQPSAPAITMVEEEETETYEEDAVTEVIDGESMFSDATEVEIAPSVAKKESVTRLSLDSNKLLYSSSGQNLASNPTVNNITYLNNYKVFNAPELDKDESIKDTDLKSLSPRYENKSAAKTAEAPPVERIELSYQEALELALVDYDNKRYAKALDRLNVIANTRPDDLNVGFYSGMSNYNMANFSEALKALEPITNDKSGVFNEEAYYYAALCYYKTGRTKKGIRMLNDIVNSGGFYADDARVFIETNR